MSTRRHRTFEDFGVVAQVKRALRPNARTACLVGFLLGGFVPLASYILAHQEFDTAQGGIVWLTVLLIAGGLVYSAKTVFAWGKLAFGSPLKALGWTVLLEGVMVCARTRWLSMSALIYLILINGVATACALTIKQVKGQF